MIRTLTASLATLAILASAVIAQEYEIVIKGATIKPTKPDGRAWDAFGGPPDPYVMAGIVGGGEQGIRRSKVCQDTYRPIWDEVILVVKEGDDVVLGVMDKDLVKDDPIGCYEFTVTRKLIEDCERIVDFDQVEKFRFIIRPKK